MRTLLAGIAAGIAMFIWSSIAHVATPLGMVGVSTLPDESVTVGNLASAIGDKGGLPLQRGRVIGVAEEMSKTLTSRVLELVVTVLQPFDRILQLFLEVLHLVLKGIQGDRAPANEPHAGLGKGQTDALVVREHLAPDGGHTLVGRMLRIQQLLPRREEVAFGPERLGGLIALLLGQRLADAEPGEQDADCSRILAKPLGGRDGPWGGPPWWRS